MKKVIKSYMMAIVAVMLVIGFSAFKVGMPPITDVWFDVELIDPSASAIPENLIIVGEAAAPPIVGPAQQCATKNDLDTCMARIDVSHLSSPNIIEGYSLKEAEDNFLAAVTPESNGDGYARKIEE